MESMKCWECLLKHLAGALSYGKEVMTGHGRGAELDHRIDLIGELVNGEHHAELLEHGLFQRLSALRKDLQLRRGNVTPKDLEVIRRLYLETERRSEGAPIEMHHGQPTPIPTEPHRPGRPNAQPPLFQAAELALAEKPYPAYEKNLDIVFGHVDSLEFFRYAMASIRRFLSNYGKIYVLRSEVDLSEFPDVETVGRTPLDFLRNAAVSEDFLWWEPSMALLRPVDAKQSFPSYSPRGMQGMQDAVKTLREDQQHQGTIVAWDHCKPQPVNKAQYLALMDGIETSFPMTVYFSLKKEPPRISDMTVTAMIDRPICCSMKRQLRECSFVTWNQAGFSSLEPLLRERILNHADEQSKG